MEKSNAQVLDPTERSEKSGAKKRRIWLFVSVSVVLAVAVTLIFWPFGKKESEGISTNMSRLLVLHQSCKLETVEITADSLDRLQGPEDATSGTSYYGVRFTIKNITKKNLKISLPLMFDAYADGVKCPFVSSEKVGWPSVIDQDLATGDQLTGMYAFELPNGWRRLILKIKADPQFEYRQSYIFENL